MTINENSKIMKDSTIYRIEVDGQIVQQDFDSYDKAQKLIKSVQPKLF